MTAEFNPSNPNDPGHQPVPEAAPAADEPQARNTHVLIVDDEKSIRISLSAFLRNEGYNVDTAQDALEAQTLLKTTEYDVVVSDIVLPGISGVELLRTIRNASSHEVQVIMMTGEPTAETAAQALRAGAADYLTKPVGKNAILKTVHRAAETRRMHSENQRLQDENTRYQKDLEQMVSTRTGELYEALEGAIQAMAIAVESRDLYTAGHQQRVARLAQAIAQEMGLDDDAVKATYLAGVVHDVGKIAVPAEILSSPARLCEEEMGLIRKHPDTGARILGSVHFPWPLAEIVDQHHERMDGSGYPKGLAGRDIRMEARILAVSDTVEAMSGHRPYRPALGIEAALAEISAQSGTHYDPDVVTACLRLFNEKGFVLDPEAGDKKTA